MRALCLCVYSFVICWSPLNVFRTHFALLGATLGFLLGAFGASWALLRVTLATLFSSLGTPLDHLGHLGLPSGAWDDLGSKRDVHFRANGSQVVRLRTKSDLVEFSAQCGVWAQSGARAAAPNPTSLAPGARMTVVKHTPSNYGMHISLSLYIYIYVYIYIYHTMY